MILERARIYREYSDECTLTIRVDSDGMCSLCIETEDGYTKADNVPEEVLIDILDRLEADEPDDVEYE